MKPPTQNGPSLERFDSARSSFGQDSQPNSPSPARSHSNPSKSHSSPSSSPSRQRKGEPIDPKNAAKVAQSYSRLHAIAGVHSVAKGIAMTPVQTCAAAYGCVRTKVNRGFLKLNKNTTPQELEENTKLFQEHKEHLKHAPKLEWKVDMANAGDYFKKAKNDWKLQRKLRKEAKGASEGSSSGSSSLGQNSPINHQIEHLTKEKYKARKQEVKEHGANQWDQSFRIANLGAKGHDSEYGMGPGEKTEEDIAKAKAGGGSHSSL